MADELEVILRRQSVIQSLRKCLAEGLAVGENYDRVGFTRHGHLRDYLTRQLPPIVDEHVFAKLSSPRVCTVEDIVEACATHLSYGIDDAFESAYDRVVTDLLTDASISRNGPRFAFCTSAICQWIPFAEEGETIWSSENGLKIVCSGHSELDLDLRTELFIRSMCEEALRVGTTDQRMEAIREALVASKQVLWAKLCGPCTRRALQAHHERLQEVVATALHSWCALTQPTFDHILDVNEPSDATTFPRIFEFVCNCLDMYFDQTDKKDSLDSRLRNAVHLLVEADKQSHKGIALALSFAAIEALVCTKTEGITEELSRNVATLLLQVALARPKGIECVKKLYGMRSKVLHGENLQVDADGCRAVRTIAGQVLLAVFEWRRFSQRMGHDEQNVRGFASELKYAQLTGQRMTGMPEIASRYFREGLF